MRKTILITICMLLVFMSSVPLFAQRGGSAKIDHERMHNDISIMEGILDKLMSQSSSKSWSSRGGTKGYYLDGYGVIFTVGISRPFSFAFSLPKIITGIAPEADFLVTLGDDDDEKDERMQEFLEGISEKNFEFLSIYADAIGQVKPKENVAIYIYSGSKSDPISLTSVKKDDIIKFRSDKIDEGLFRERIKYDDLTELENNKLGSQIDIMSSILTTALGSGSRNRMRGYVSYGSTEADVRGLYLDNFGALFLVSVPGIFGGRGVGNTFMVYNEALDELFLEGSITTSRSAPRSTEKSERVKKREAEYRQQIEKYKQELEEYKTHFSELLGNYGHTLRLIKSNEWIGVITNIGSNRNNYVTVGRRRLQTPRTMIIKVRKGDADKFNTGRMSSADFAKTIVFDEFPQFEEAPKER